MRNYRQDRAQLQIPAKTRCDTMTQAASMPGSKHSQSLYHDGLKALMPLRQPFNQALNSPSNSLSDSLVDRQLAGGADLLCVLDATCGG